MINTYVPELWAKEILEFLQYEPIIKPDLGKPTIWQRIKYYYYRYFTK